jgi:uncharacterized protein DUF6922
VTLRALFWDYEFAALSCEDDRDLIMARVLISGDWAAVTWLCSHTGDRALREWLEQHHGGGMSPRRLRFWEVILELPHRRVNAWRKRSGGYAAFPGFTDGADSDRGRREGGGWW